ncbi:MAG: PAS domain-containing protein, partial [Dehalococcoidia bacterium]
MQTFLNDALASHLRVRTSSALEWAWAMGRFAVVAMTVLGASLYLRGTPAFIPVLGTVAGVAVYNSGILLLLRWGRTNDAFRLGFVLDHAVILGAWWFVSSQLAEEATASPTDLYLVLFPLITLGVVRLGILLGALYVAAWSGWLVWVSFHFFGAGSYPVEQLPLRLSALVISGGLLMWLVSQRDVARSEGRTAMGQYEALFDTMDDAVFVTSPEGRIVDLNRAAGDLLGLAPDNVRGVDIGTLVRARDRDMF